MIAWIFLILSFLAISSSHAPPIPIMKRSSIDNKESYIRIVKPNNISSYNYTSSSPITLNNTATSIMLTYYGGPVIANVQVVPIYYGPNVADMNTITAFYAAVVNSPHMDMCKLIMMNTSFIIII